MKTRLLGLSLLAASAAGAAAQEPSPAARALFDNCMGNPSSTAAFCRCGIDYYGGHLSPQDLAIMAAVSDGVAAGRRNAFDEEATKLGLTATEKAATGKRIEAVAKSAVAACDHLISPRSGSSQ